MAHIIEDRALVGGPLVTEHDQDRASRSDAWAVDDLATIGTAILPPTRRAGRGVLRSVPAPQIAAPLVAIVEPIGALRLGLRAALAGSGYSAATADHGDDLEDMAPDYVLWAVSEREIEVLQRFTQRTATPVVALQDPGEAVTVQALLAAGATSVLARGASPEAHLLALDALRLGLRVLPDVPQPSTGPAVSPRALFELTPEERGWLADLAAGTTVAVIAAGSGYSERELYRRLARVYAKLGASGRVDAILRARRLGIV